MKKFELNNENGIIGIGFDIDNYAEHLTVKYPVAFLWKDYDDYEEANISLLPLKDNEIFTLLNDFPEIDFYSDFTGREEELYDNIKSFLSLFRKGNYGLSFFNQEENRHYIELSFSERPDIKDIKRRIEKFELDFENGKIRTPERKGNLYIRDYEYDFIPVKAKSKIDASRILFYENEIKEGKRPFILAYTGNHLGDDFHYYILDGHHKIIAYQNLGMKPPYALISYFPENFSEVEFDIEYISQNFDPQRFYEFFQEWSGKAEFIKNNPGSILQKFIKNGTFCFYYPNGRKLSEGHYIDDLPDGEQKTWDHNGELQSIRHYNKGLNAGKWLFFDDKGQTTHENIFNDFNKQILGKWFYEGRQMHENIWDYDHNGNLLSFKSYDEFGNISNEAYYENNVPVIQKHFERDGEIKKLEIYNEEEKRIISVPLNEQIILEYSTEKYIDQKRRIKAWHDKNDPKITKFREAELRKKLDDTIENQDFISNIRMIFLVIILLILLFTLI